MTWEAIPLESLAVRRGGSVNPAKFPNETFELFSIPAFDQGTAEICKGRNIGSQKKCVEPNDVLLSRIVPHIRRSWIVSESNGHRQIASGEWIQFRNPDVDPNYLRHYLVSDPFHHQFMQTVSGVGGSLLRARPAEVFKIRLPLPPLVEQKRIAAILDAVDALRAKRRESLIQLETLVQSTFLTLFGDPVENPIGWPICKIGDILMSKLISGAYYPKDQYSTNGTAMVHMADAFYGVVDLEDLKRVDIPDEDKTKYHVSPTDLLISRRSLNYEGSAKPCLIPNSREPLIFESSLIRLRPDLSKALVLFLYTYLSNQRARAHFVFPLVTRSTISGINQSNLSKVRLYLPPLDLQRRFAAIVESIEKQKASQRAHLAELDALFASLQHRAFNGELSAA